MPDALEPNLVEPNSAYLSVFLRSMRVVHVRKGLRKFYGTVHSYISLPHLSGDRAKFHVVTTPAQLKDTDAQNIDRVVLLNDRLLGPIPYRGGDLEIELGLFSIKSADLAAPFLGLLEEVASAAGVAYVNVALPFVEPLTAGFNLLAGAGGGDNILEIGLANTFDKPKTGYFLVMRAQKGEVSVPDLKLDGDYRLVDRDGEPIREYPYMVFSIEASTKRDDWFEIPDVAAAHRTLEETVRRFNVTTVKEAFTIFKRTAMSSPDLLFSDAERLANDVGNELERVLEEASRPWPKGDPIAYSPSRRIPWIRPLEMVDLYGS